MKMPYAVGSSVSLSYALAVHQATGANLMTDSRQHHKLLLSRLATAAADDGPAMYSPPPSPYKQRQIELRVIERLAPADELRRMDFSAVLQYRLAREDARQELATWMDRLAKESREREWDPQLEAELAEFARRARDIARQPGRWKTAAGGVKRNVTVGAIAAASGTAALTAVVSPWASGLAALLLGGPPRSWTLSTTSPRSARRSATRSATCSTHGRRDRGEVGRAPGPPDGVPVPRRVYVPHAHVNGAGGIAPGAVTARRQPLDDDSASG
jgi:hypothetical protein